MSNERIRTLEEWAEIYRLHPDLRNVFVEGSCDAGLIIWYLKESGKRDIGVYEISTVKIDANSILSYGLEDNNRGRVITFGLDIEPFLTGNPPQVTCIADRDFDLVLNIKYGSKTIIFTDYSCLEMYLFNEKCLTKFLAVYARNFRLTPAVMLQQMSSVLPEIFLIRLANKLLDLNLSWVPLQRCCKLIQGKIKFDKEDFLFRYLNTKGMTGRKKDVLALLDAYKRKLNSDARHNIHGHDFIQLLKWYLQQNRVSASLLNEEAINRILFTCAEYQQIKDEPMFRNLLLRFTKP